MPSKARTAKVSRLSITPAGKGILRLLPADSVTEHTVDTAQGKLAYTATAGTLAFFGESGDQTAAVFYTAYVAKNGGANRPLTFVFNGGPGAASAFLNLGLVGPRLLDFGPDARDFAHAKLRDNPDTWLRFTDLVLIDPIGTGWSRTVKPDAAKGFWNVGSDADAMAKAIALYVGKNNRIASPKYLLGESYGGFRAAKTARALQREQGISVDGIVMLSPFLEGWLTFADDQSALRAALELPSLAAAELERKNALTPQALAAAEKFALTDYLTTLAGPTPQGKAAEDFYARVAKASGLPLDTIKRQRGFVTDTFVKNLRAGKIVSQYDPNFAVDDPFPERRSRTPPRSDPRRRGARLWRRLRQLRAQRARLQDRDDLQAVGRRCHRALGLGQRRPLRRRRRRRSARAAELRPLVPPADRARLFGSGHAVFRHPLFGRPSAADRPEGARLAQALSRRAHDLSGAGLAHRLQQGRGGVLPQGVTL